MNTVCIIDGGNLRHFPYKIDYKKLYAHVTDMGADKVFYIGSLPSGRYYAVYDWVGNDFMDLDIFGEWVNEYERICNSPTDFRNSTAEYRIQLTGNDDAEFLREKELLDIQQIKKQLGFMLLLKSIGYNLELTPLKKHVRADDDSVKAKGDSDVRIAVKIFDIADTIQNIILVSGDGDFLPLLKRMVTLNKKVTVMGYRSKDRFNQTAKEIVSFAGGYFRNFADSDTREKIEFHG